MLGPTFVGMAACGLAVVGLTISGLAGKIPMLLACISGIVMGLACLGLGAAVIAQLRQVTPTELESRAASAMGSWLMVVAGVAGIVLSAVALGNPSSGTLVAVADIVVGIALTAAGLATFTADLPAPLMGERQVEIVPGGRFLAPGMTLFGGLATFVLGVIAVTGQATLVLDLTGLLVAGAAVLFAGSLYFGRYKKYS